MPARPPSANWRGRWWTGPATCRRCRLHVGPRYLARGLNDAADPGNEIECEQVVWKHAPPGAPNIVIILMDDMGYADPGCFGGEIDTPQDPIVKLDYWTKLEELGLVNRVSESSLTADEVYVRSGIVCNNLVDYYSTRFTDRALSQIVDLWNDTATAPNCW